MPDRRTRLIVLMVAVMLPLSGAAPAGAQSRVFTAPAAVKLAIPSEPGAGPGSVTAACKTLTARTDCTSGELLAGCAATLKADPDWCESYAAKLTRRDPGWLHGTTRNTPSTTPASPVAPRRPADPPAPAAPAAVLATGATGAAAAIDSNVSSGTGRDLLMSNGLISPWCAAGRTFSAAAARNCKASGSTATAAAADNVGFDTHIDTSTALGVPKPAQTFASIVSSLMQLAWLFCLAVTRGIFWLVELALSFNPLQAVGGQHALQLLSAEIGAITRPLALILAPAGAVWVIAQFGWARKQGEALKHAFLSTLLIAASVVVLSNPIGTIGALLTTSQQVGLGIIGAVVAPVTGTPATNGASGAQAGLRALSDGLIEQPLSLLEFGDVDFGTDPAQLDDTLRKAALKLANDDPDKLAAVRAARTNLDLFEVWPAGSSARNAINDESSLLRALCGSDDATDCKGPHASQAEFRTEKGTWQRAIGLLVILAGLLPVWIALLFTAFKLLEAGVMCLIRLCQLVFITPLAVLGKEGNERVIRYAGGFTGNLLASTAYSAFLALIFLLWVLLTRFGTLGFVGQWLLLAVLLWLLVRHHDSLWGAARSQEGHMRSRGMQMAQMALGYRVSNGISAAGRSGRRSAAGAARGAGPATKTRWTSGLPARAPRPGRDRDALGGKPSAGAGAGASASGAARPSTGRGAGASVPVVVGAAAATAVGSATGAPSTGTAGAVASSVRAKRAGAALKPKLLEGGKPAAWSRLRAQHKAIGTTRAAHATRVLSSTWRPDLQQRRERIGRELTAVAAALPASSGPERKQLVRRGSSLAQRAQRLDGQLSTFANAQRVAEEIVSPKQRTAREAQFLDRQNKLRRGQAPAPARAAAHRNYPQLAGLVGQTPGQYRAGGAQEQLRARARIDRELAQRSKDQREVRRPAVRAVPGAAAASAAAAAAAPVAAAGSGGGPSAPQPGRRGGRPVARAARRRAPGSSGR